MRISEMQQREPFEQVLATTLSAGWSEQHGTDIRLLDATADEGSLWLMQPLLSACYIPLVRRRVRLFLRDSFCYSPVAWRIPAQWTLGTLLASELGLRYMARSAFRVSKVLPHEDSLLVVPGNQRIRVFDFQSGACRVFLKSGFSAETMLREIEVRGQKRNGPFPTISSWHAMGAWFDEPIIDGFALPRCPPWLSCTRFEREAFDLLDEWLKGRSIKTDVGGQTASLRTSIQQQVEKIRPRLDIEKQEDLERWTRILAQWAGFLGQVPVAETHGDFQPGNILVERNTHDVTIIDWEHSSRRYQLYDHLVYELRTRSPSGLARRLKNFIHGRAPGYTCQRLPTDRTWRRAALALFLLEDIDWYLHENATGPYVEISRGLVTYCQQLKRLGHRLEHLLEDDVK